MADTSSSQVDAVGARSTVYRCLDLVQSDPELALSMAAGFIDDTDPEVAVIALWATGRANYERAHFAESEEVFNRAIALGRRFELADVVAQIRVSLAAVHLELGRTARALRELDRAAAEISEQFAGRVLKQRSFVLFQLGRTHEAVRDADRALPLLRREQDQLGEARLLINRGIARLALDDLGRAESDLRACRDLAVQIDQYLIVAAADHNLAFLAGRRGDVAGALRLYEQARIGYHHVGDPRRVMPILDADISETLLSAGLAADAAQSATRSLESALESGDVLQQAEARLRLARALLAGDDSAGAMEHARGAAVLFRKAGRRPWQALANFVMVQSELATTPRAARPGALLNRAEKLLGVLDAEGWRREAALLRIGLGRLAAELGQVERAQRHLAAAQGKGTSSIDRLHTWQAVALSRFLAGDQGGAARAARQGLRALTDYRAQLGSTELRVSASAMAAQLVEIGVRVAIARGQPRSVVQWTEELRAASTRVVAPPTRDAILDSLLDQHRALSRTASDDRLAADRPAVLQAEAAVVAYARQSFPGRGAPHITTQLAGLGAILAGRTLVSFGQCDGTMYASVFSGRACRLHTIAPTRVMSSEIAYLRAAARRMLSGYDPGPAVTAALDNAASTVERLLIDPLQIRFDQPVIIVPSGPLYGLPWGLLPALTEIAFVVAPSVMAWRRIEQAPISSDPARDAIVVGPGLQSGHAESQRFATGSAATTVLDGAAASVDNTRQAFTSSNLVHLAAHGTFRGDSPLLSSFRMHDGPLTVFDIEQLATVPEVMILPSCEAGSVSTHPGDDLMGVAAALVGRGVMSLIAPLDSVPDAAVVEPMHDLHLRILRSEPTAEALRTTRCELPPGSIERAALSTFLCVGASVRIARGARSE
ncbi:MAG: CHAT domain-containing tetratricopeptide repeat protein [Ilumatobacteraceae bacterium]